METASGSAPILARCGNRLETWSDTPEEETAEWERIFREREYDSTQLRKMKPSIREIWEGDWHFTDKDPADVRISLDWDWKRRLVNVTTRNGVLAADTAPWNTVDEFMAYRDAWEKWRRRERRILRTERDYWQFLDFYRYHSPVNGRGRSPDFTELTANAAARGIVSSDTLSRCSNQIESAKPISGFRKSCRTYEGVP